jgi:hypothetical protein
VPEGEFRADPLGDLAALKGELSVWRLDEGRTELQVAAATAALLNPGSLDYLLIDEQALQSSGFILQHCAGQSADPGMNKKCHHDIVHLTERSLLNLAALFRAKGQMKTCAQPTIMQVLADGISQGTVDRRQIKERWIKYMVEADLLDN